MSKGKVFYGYVNGYSFVTDKLVEMQAWIDVRKQDCKGSKLTLRQASGTLHDSAWVDGMPSREVVL